MCQKRAKMRLFRSNFRVKGNGSKMNWRRLICFLAFFLAAGGFCTAGPEKPGNFDALTQWMEDFLAKHEVPGGAIAVTQNGRLVYAQGFGLANPETSENFQPDTPARVGSLSNLVTSAALLKLSDRGGIDFDARVFGPMGLLPYPVPADADPRVAEIRLKELFTMSSGWKAASDTSASFATLGLLAESGLSLPASRDFVSSAMLSEPLANDPGKIYDYLNISPIFLAKVLSLKSGKPYEEQVTETLLQPLGLRAPRIGGTRAADRQISEATYGTGVDLFPSLYPGDGMVPLSYAYGLLDLQLIAPTGGWVFSAVDFAMLLSHAAGERKPALLSPDSRATLSTRPEGVQTWQDTANFYGFHTEAFENGAVWGKYGSMPGVAAWAASLPNNLGVVIVLNGREMAAPEVYDPPFAGTTFDQEIRDGIQNALRELPRVSGDLFRSTYQAGRPALFGLPKATGTVGVPFSHTLNSQPRNAVFSTTGIVPGLRFNPLNGELKGAPKQAGRYLLPVTVSNNQGAASGLLEVVIAEPGTPVVSGEALCPEKFQNVIREGRVVDEVVMLGSTLTVRPRTGIGTRVIFIDADGDLSIAELSGPGTLTITLENAVLRASAKYPARGDAGFVLADTTSETTFRLYAIGKLNGQYQASGDGVATARNLTVNSPAVGNLFLGNSRFHASVDAAGIKAGGTAVESVVIGEIDAESSAVPSLLFGQAREVFFLGSRMLQSNGQPVQATGISGVTTYFGADANGKVFPNRRPEAKFVDNSVDITDKLFPLKK